MVISFYLHFAGHYVIICGYDADDCEFEIRDPASSRCVIFSLQLEVDHAVLGYRSTRVKDH
jgi:hypothetical protein